MGDFTKEYQKLNKAQQAAVDAVQGAVLVLAGPGTGKTQLLSLRVANILNITDAVPENILCLTFTNKAAANMQLRLSSLIGSQAHKVMIKTFHSFAAEIMNLYPDYFWNGAQLVTVPDAVQLEIITDILSALSLDNPLALKFAGQFTSTGSVLEALKLTKEAGLTPEKLRALIQLNVDYINLIEPMLIDICAERLTYKKLDELAMQIEALPMQHTDDLTRPLVALSTVIQESFEAAHSADEGTNKTKHVSAWKLRWLKTVDGQKGMYDERTRNNWWLSLVNVYEGYRSNLHERGFYDYSDMIIEVITRLEQNRDMLADVQEKFQYVLIDEFQDTNAAQLRLAHLVADHHISEGNPNIMAVGDDKQSIYKFNGAELSNMHGFSRSYPKAQVFELVDNYRSSQEILDFSLEVIDQLAERPIALATIKAKKLIAKNTPKDQGKLEHISYPTKEHEYYGTAKNIAKDWTKQKGSIAVLARNHDSLKAIAHILHELKVPVRYEQQQSVLEQPIVKQLIAICEIVHALNTGNEVTVNSILPQLLQDPSWNISPIQMWKLAIENRQSAHWIDSMLANDENLQIIAHWLLWLSRESAVQPLPRILEYALGLNASEHLTSPLRRYYLECKTIDTPYLAGISAVHKLIGLAEEFCIQGQPTTADFLRLLHVNQENNRTITDQSLFVTAPNAVELLTVYKAKGLEFDNVYIIDAMESIWKPSTRGRKPPSNLPLRPAGDDYDDYVRLMFVAVTRAKRTISINTYYTNSLNEPALPSSIIRDILPARIITFENAGSSISVLEHVLSWPRLEGSVEKELLNNILERYTLSPSAFLDFLDVTKGGPHYFLEKYLLRLPEAQSVRAAFGNAMHSALEKTQQLIINNSFDIDQVLIAYEEALIKQELVNEEHQRYLEHGQKILMRLFNEYNLEILPSGRAEEKLSVSIGDTLFAGKLDRVDFNSATNTLLISDYKTGTPLSSFITHNSSIELKAWRHRTQLSLYAIMARESGRYKDADVTTQMIYVEAETKKELVRTFTPTKDDLEILSKLIGIVGNKITSLNLPDIRHYDTSFSGTKKFIEDLLSGSI